MGTGTVSNKKRSKAAKSALAVALALLLALGGTFAYYSGQTVTNQFEGSVNSGGRLHDDFVYLSSQDQPASYVSDSDLVSGADTTKTRTKANTNHDKDIYVENYLGRDETNGVDATNVYARVRLFEYMAIDNNVIGKTDAQEATPSTWDNHYAADSSDVYSSYFRWDEGNEQATTYMPTFNTDNTSNDADIRGKYDDKSAADPSTDDPYSTYIKYAKGATAEGTESGGATAEHVAKETGTAKVMSMAQWKTEGCHAGPYWVYDETDGWVYWAQPIEPQSATGLLLNDVTMTNVPNNNWSYKIHAEAQIVTSDEWVSTDDGGYQFSKTSKAAGTETPMSGDAFYLMCVAAGNDRGSNYTVTVSLPEGVTQVEADSYVQATATVTGPSGAVENPELSWTVSGAGSNSAVNENGLVKVAPDAWNNQNLTITAALKQYPTVKGSATIRVAYSTSAGRLNTLKTMPVSQAASDTVTIDGIKWYKLAQDGDNVMIWSADAIGWNSNRSTPFGTSPKWATVDAGGNVTEPSNVRTYLNGEFIASLSTLGGKAVDTIVHTRSDYKSEYNQAALDSGKTQITPEWYDTTDKAFVLSEADLFGTAGSVVDADGKSVDIATAKDQRDYTVPNATVGSPAVSTALRSFNCDFTYWSWLRSPFLNDKCVANVAANGLRDASGYISANGAIRPALWVNLASS